MSGRRRGVRQGARVSLAGGALGDRVTFGDYLLVRLESVASFEKQPSRIRDVLKLLCTIVGTILQDCVIRGNDVSPVPVIPVSVDEFVSLCSNLHGHFLVVI